MKRLSIPFFTHTVKILKMNMEMKMAWMKLACFMRSGGSRKMVLYCETSFPQNLDQLIFNLLQS